MPHSIDEKPNAYPITLIHSKLVVPYELSLIDKILFVRFLMWLITDFGTAAQQG